MKIAGATPKFKAAYEKRYSQLKKIGFVQPHLSSLAKKYAALDIEVQDQQEWFNKNKYLMKINKDLASCRVNKTSRI